MFAADDVEDIDQSGQRARGILAIASCRADRVDDLGLGVGLCFHCFGHFQKSLQLERRLRNDQRGV